MKRMVILLGMTLAVGIAVGIIGDRILNAQQEPIKRAVLIKTDLPGITGKEARLIRAEYAPGAAVGKHHHPGHEFVYLLEGSATLDVEGKPPVTMKAGDSYYQPPKQVHSFKNASATNPAKLITFFVTEKDQPFIVPVK